MKLLYGILFGILGQIGSFMQLQGAIRYGWLPKYLWPILIAGIPIGWVYIKSVEYIVSYFGGQIWPSRLIGFGVGIVMFSLLSSILFKEPLTPKTLVSIGLGLLIVTLQIVWK